MERPTYDELEAMAQYWTDQMAKAVMQDAMLAAEKFSQTAAMLRACKGRVRPLPRGDGEGGWTLPMELLAEIRDEVYANEWDAPCAEVIEIIALSVEARILAAEAEHDALRAELAEAVELISVSLKAVNWSFAAGSEERENGSARRQGKLLDQIRPFETDARAIIARHQKGADT